MVKLTRIYTRGGDRGQTSLGDGRRVAKHDPRVAAYGAIDETNAVIGLARQHTAALPEIDLRREQLRRDQSWHPWQQLAGNGNRWCHDIAG